MELYCLDKADDPERSDTNNYQLCRGCVMDIRTGQFLAKLVSRI